MADLTCIRVLGRFVHLAVILDARSRRVAGRALGRRIDAGLALAAPEAAIVARRPLPGRIRHSDRGPRCASEPCSRYAAEPYRRKLAAHGPGGSTGRRGKPHDHAKAESLTKALEHEEVHLGGHETFQDAAARLPRFPEEVYDAGQPRSALGYPSPARFGEIDAREAT